MLFDTSKIKVSRLAIARTDRQNMLFHGSVAPWKLVLLVNS